MKLQIFTIWDSAVGAFLQPFFVRSKGEAIRSFTDAVNDEKGMFNKHVTDYTLMWIGEFDDNAGSLVAVSPERVLTATEALRIDDIFPPDRKVS